MAHSLQAAMGTMASLSLDGRTRERNVVRRTRFSRFVMEATLSPRRTEMLQHKMQYETNVEILKLAACLGSTFGLVFVLFIDRCAR